MKQSSLFAILVFSNLSNLSPTLGFLFNSNTFQFSQYIIIVFLSQLIWPILNLRLDIQIQVELARSKQDYFFKLSLYLALLVIFLTTTIILFVEKIYRFDTYTLWNSLLLGSALVLQGTARSRIIASKEKKT